MTDDVTDHAVMPQDDITGHTTHSRANHSNQSLMKSSIAYIWQLAGWMHSKHYITLVFHVTLNSCNIYKNDVVCWGSLDIQNVLHVSFKTMYFVL